MTNLRIDPESERLLDERLKSPEGRKLMDDLLRVIAMGLVDEWVRNGRQVPTLEEIQKELRDAVTRTLMPPTKRSTRIRDSRDSKVPEE